MSFIVFVLGLEILKPLDEMDNFTYAQNKLMKRGFVFFNRQIRLQNVTKNLRRRRQTRIQDGSNDYSQVRGDRVELFGFVLQYANRIDQTQNCLFPEDVGILVEPRLWLISNILGSQKYLISVVRGVCNSLGHQALISRLAKEQNTIETTSSKC